LYQPAGAVGPSGGTSRDPLARRPSWRSADCLRMAGILSETGGEYAITGGCVVAASEDCAADDDSAGLAVGVAETDDGISVADGCIGAVPAQPVRTKRATPTEANPPLRGSLLELII
jgi:hypothetical protein